MMMSALIFIAIMTILIAAFFGLARLTEWVVNKFFGL